MAIVVGPLFTLAAWYWYPLGGVDFFVLLAGASLGLVGLALALSAGVLPAAARLAAVLYGYSILQAQLLPHLRSNPFWQRTLLAMGIFLVLYAVVYKLPGLRSVVSPPLRKGSGRG
ncbi:MAG: hypothetical protein M3P51_10505 [Chloroflexota bacterium]|nr:hypothetical protein [Chloroflexota bacterium]